MALQCDADNEAGVLHFIQDSSARSLGRVVFLFPSNNAGFSAVTTGLLIKIWCKTRLVVSVLVLYSNKFMHMVAEERKQEFGCIACASSLPRKWSELSGSHACS
jgi:hypothetical protein